MQDFALFLKILAERVYTAELPSGLRVLDASDFHDWLVEASRKAEQSSTVEEFFSRV